MGFNYNKEKAKFDRQWAKLRKQYEELGMSQETIKKIYDFDLEWFKSRRRYINHMADLPEETTIEDIPQSGTESAYGDIPAGFDTEPNQWLDEIEDDCLLQKLILLSEDDLDLLTHIVFEGYTQSEIAQKEMCSQMAISKHLNKIRKILN